MTNLVDLPFRRKKRPSVVELLQLYRNRSGWSRGVLASQLGFQSDRMIRKWETGTSLPDSKRLQKLLELYLKNQIFSSSHQQEEAEELWATVKEAFEIQSHTYEIYPLFDKAWFKALVQEENFAKTGRLEVEKKAQSDQPATTNLSPNLPVPVASFIGRRRDIELIKSLITTNRLITITGAPGCGKTRLALEIAGELLSQFKNRVWLVELDGMVDNVQLLPTIGGVLEIREPVTYKSLAQNLAGKEGLLLFDTCEHILEVCAEIIQKLIRQCPKLTVIAISRENLGIDGEIVYPVKPLSVAGLEISAFHETEAIKLFNDRAKTVQPDFGLTEETIPLVTRIVRELDGLPVLIELVVQKLEVLTLDQIVARMSQPFYLLKSSSGAIPLRHQSLMALYDWSYRLLNPKEKVFFKLLCFLAPKFNLEIIEKLNLAPVLDNLYSLDLMEGLVKKCLVEVEKVGETVTYTLLETARLYGQHKAQEEGDL